MKNSSFVHCHVHQDLSLLDGIGKPDIVVSKAKELGFKSLAITDHGTIDGTLKFQKECIKNDIKPILGCELYCLPDMDKKEKGVRSYHCIVLVKNQIGWNNLLNILTTAHIQGFYAKPRISFDYLFDHSDGLVISTACSQSFLLADEGMDFFNELNKKRNGEDLFLECQPHPFEEQLFINNLVYKIHKKTEIPLLAANDCHYPNEEDWESHDVLLAMQRKKVMSDKTRWKFNIKGLHLRTADEMIDAFLKQKHFNREIIIEAIKNSLLINDACNFIISKQEINLPPVPGLENINEAKYLRELTINGYYEKIGNIVDPIYEQRFEYELKVICDKNFARYFLIVHDMYQWMRKNNFFVSPGRGSIGSSLVAYLIGITNVDPIKYDLPFTRFLDEERDDLPDADIDVEDRRRDELLNYLKSSYGENNVANISTFLTLKGRGIIRDVARTFEIPSKEVDEFAKTVNESLAEAYELDKEFAKKYPDVKRHSLVLENISKAKGKHAAGIIISNEDLLQSNKCNVELRDGQRTVNWDLADAEYNGLIKFDLLGLNCLSILAETKRLVYENHNVDIDYFNMKLNDPKVFEELSNGNTTGIFQFGTKSMTELSIIMGIESFQHMIDAVALVRPGAKDAGLTAEYINRKHGQKWEPKHPIYEDITKNTYGVYAYQEQIMHIFNRIAGLPMSLSNKIRKIIGKKRDAREFEQYKEMFMKGCKKQKTFTQDEAEEFWEQLQYSASYLFNSAHSIEYSMLGYWTMYSKIYYPQEFLAASLTCGSDTHKPKLVREARRLGLEIISPKIGLSDPFKWICVDNKLHIAFNEIKGLGPKTLDKLQLPKYEDGFYQESKVEIKGKPKKILDEIKAFDKDAELPLDAYKYFDFDLSEGGYDKLLKLLKVEKSEIDIDKALRGELTGLNLIRKRNDYPEVIWEELENCELCELRQECKKPIYPSLSKYNIFLVGEAGWKDEDREGRGFVGRSGKKLWEELAKYDLHRWCFHISNVVKCSPLKTRTPKESHIQACSKWLDMEINQLNPFMILAFGNTNVFRFKNQRSGIKSLNGTTEWNDKYGCWIHWGIHPSAALRNEENNELFKIAIKSFSQKLTDLGGV